MYYTIPFTLFLFLIIGLIGCDNVSSVGGGPVSRGTENGDSEDWLIPVNQVIDGGPGKDGIPSIDNPQFISVNEVPAYLQDNDLIVGVRIGDIVRAYPHPILDWHEIVNDVIDNKAFSVTYCPLTGSAVSWNRTLTGRETTFGVSGLLYNSNLIAYDRATDSYWSQMMMQSVHGELIGDRAGLITIIETRWDTWKELYTESEILSTNTGFNRQYGNFPYGNYKTSNQLIFPVSNDDDRLHRKERVLGTIYIDHTDVVQKRDYFKSNSTTNDRVQQYNLTTETRVFQIDEFPDTIHTINDAYQDYPLVTVGSSKYNFAAAYERSLRDGTLLEFKPVQNQLPIVMEDNEGTQWDIFGFAVNGPRAGAQLTQANSYIAYWFAWAAFYPDAEIHLP